MEPSSQWTTVTVPELTELPRPVALRSQILLRHHTFPPHQHRWHQFVYATSGTLLVTVGSAWHVITPEQAIWVPQGMVHATGALQDAAFRNLYVADRPDLRMPGSAEVFRISPLLRELIIELVAVGQRNEEAGYRDRLDSLIVDQLQRLERQDVSLPWPHSRPLRRLCDAIYAAPDDERSLEAWGRELGLSPRTLTRHFEREVGLSLRRWRQRLRLFRAIEWLGLGRSITQVALDLGYASPSAFIYMFRQEMGVSPKAFSSQSKRS